VNAWATFFENFLKKHLVLWEGLLAPQENSAQVACIGPARLEAGQQSQRSQEEEKSVEGVNLLAVKHMSALCVVQEARLLM
jgi:hypothetical protein